MAYSPRTKPEDSSVSPPRKSLMAQIYCSLTALLIAVYFFRLVRGTLHVYFTPDDTMNLYRSWTFPLTSLITANILFFQSSPFYRPMGSVWYRLIYHFAGFNPGPFHTANLIILTANIFLTYAVARRLSRSRKVGALAALLVSYHPGFTSLYFDTGFIYDVLCYFFYFAGFLLYLKTRQEHAPHNNWALTACCILFICALNSKEMAATLPLSLLVYEVFYNSFRSRSLRDLYCWIFTEGRVIATTSVIAATFVVGRQFGEYSLIREPAYQLSVTWSRLMDNCTGLLDGLFFQTNWFQPASVLLVWALLLIVACTARTTVLRFAWAFMLFSMIPVVFAVRRGGPQYYIPLFGWCLYMAAILARGTAFLLARSSTTATGCHFWMKRIRAPLLFLCVVLSLYPYYKAQGWSSLSSVTEEAPFIRKVVSQMQALHPRMPTGARLFFLNDPYKSPWGLLITVRLVYRDPTIIVDRRKTMSRRPTERELSSYDFVFDYSDSQFVARAFPQLPLIPGFAMATTLRLPEIYHTNWSIVTASRPAKRGEVLIAKVTNLGATSPDVAPDTPFPRDPLAQVLSRLAVTVTGHRAEVINQIGWPEMVNMYRLDFRVPDDTPTGMATVTLAVKDVLAQPVIIPVH